MVGARQQSTIAARVSVRENLRRLGEGLRVYPLLQTAHLLGTATIASKVATGELTARVYGEPCTNRVMRAQRLSDHRHINLW